jgi:hypothetical protein
MPQWAFNDFPDYVCITVAVTPPFFLKIILVNQEQNSLGTLGSHLEQQNAGGGGGTNQEAEKEYFYDCTSQK